jgi:hypothetical protein
MSSHLVGGFILGVVFTVLLLVAYGIGTAEGQHHCAKFPKDSACVAHAKDGGHR